MSWRRIALATVVVVAVAAAASVYALTTPKRYDATARVVVHTIPASDTTFTGIDVLRATGDTPRDLGTAAEYFHTPDVVSATATRLSLSPSTLSRSLDVRPLAGSNVLLIVGRASSPQLAAQIANGIVQEAIAQRTARVQAQVSAILNKLRLSSSTEARRRAIDLQALQSRPDPTLETLSAATAPTSSAWPKPVRTISEATLAALVVAALFLLLPKLAAAMPRRVPATTRDVGFDDQEEALRRRAAAIDQREKELKQVLRDAKKATEATSSAGALLEKRTTAVTGRERALATQAVQHAARERDMAKEAAQHAERERELAKGEAALEKQVAESRKVAEPKPVQAPAPVPEPARAPAVAPAQSDLVVETPGVVTTRRPGEWTIQELERLVAERGEAFPDQIEEWRYYVHFLSEHAGRNGELPASFDYLIEDTFAGIL